MGTQNGVTGEQVVYTRPVSDTHALGLVQLVDFDQIERVLPQIVLHYEQSAPTVARFVDELYARLHDERVVGVSVYELLQVQLLVADGSFEHPNYAANRMLKLKDTLGLDTTGDLGF